MPVDLIAARRRTAAESPEARALRVLLTLVSHEGLWGNVYLDRARVDAAMREAGLVDEAGEWTEFGKRYAPRGERGG